jgi:5-formyltetrahydrofolate cyclo-ligase
MKEIMINKQLLRIKMRRERQNLSKQQQQIASKNLLKNLLSLTSFNESQHISIYLAADGEIDPLHIIDYCWAHDKAVYLPVLDPDKHNQLLFVRYLADTKMSVNKYQIAEPSLPYHQIKPAQELDLALFPLVAFDEQGHRMGMGGGYYDRSFEFKHLNENTKESKPMLVGLAHEIQKVEDLTTESWDIPLSNIITDQAIYKA